MNNTNANVYVLKSAVDSTGKQDHLQLEIRITLVSMHPGVILTRLGPAHQSRQFCASNEKYLQFGNLATLTPTKCQQRLSSTCVPYAAHTQSHVLTTCIRLTALLLVCRCPWRHMSWSTAAQEE
jgi:hypothetical protein